MKSLKEIHGLLETVKSNNTKFGYHGTVKGKDDEKARKYHATARAIIAATGEPSERKVRDFLDSAHGRHLADEHNSNAQNIMGKDDGKTSAKVGQAATDPLGKSFGKSWAHFSKNYNPAHFESFYDVGKPLEEEVLNEMPVETVPGTVSPVGYGDRDFVNMYSDLHHAHKRHASNHEYRQKSHKDQDPELSQVHSEIAAAHRKAARGYEQLTRHHMGRLLDKMNEEFTEEEFEALMEEVLLEEEQIDELSTQTLRSYVKKASEDYGDLKYERGLPRTTSQISDLDRNRVGNRRRGIAKAVDQMVKKEEVENLDELSAGTLGRYIRRASFDNTATAFNTGVQKKVRAEDERRMRKRDEGIVRASHKLEKKARNEETEQLDELEKKTLSSYRRKAMTSHARAGAKMDREEDKAMSTDGNKYPEKQARHNANANDAHKVWLKRLRGIEMADRRLGKRSR